MDLNSSLADTEAQAFKPVGVQTSWHSMIAQTPEQARVLLPLGNHSLGSSDAFVCFVFKTVHTGAFCFPSSVDSDSLR